VQEGGDVTFKATDDPLAVMPERAKRAGETHAHVTWNEPLEGTERLLTALAMRVNEGNRPWSRPTVADQRLMSWNTAHVLVRQSSLR